MAKIEAGDFIRLDYTGRLASSSRVFDTTSAEEAKKAGIFSEKAVYKPVLVAVGKRMILAGLDDALIGMEPDGKKTIELPPEQAFGVRNPDLVTVVPLANFHRNNINPVPGMPVTLDNRNGRVRSVGGGRVVVDMNSDLAGETVRYDVQIKAVIEGRDRQAEEILEDVGLTGDVKASKDSIEVKVPAEVAKGADYFLRKSKFVAATMALLGAKNVRVVEEFAAPKPEKEPKKEAKSKKG